jgi:glucokinase
MVSHRGVVEVLLSAGGHVSFAPENEIETELLRYLRRKYDHVSYERILSGQGITSIYEFLMPSGYAPESAELRERMRKEDPAVVIAKEGEAGTDALCVKALEKAHGGANRGCVSSQRQAILARARHDSVSDL